MAILTNYALKNEIFSKIVNTKNTTIILDGYEKSINNTHELLGYTEGVYGVKTGFTGNAGRCLVTACNRNNLDIIIVILGADTKKIRTTDTINLINYIYNNFETIDTSDYINKKISTSVLDIKNTNSLPKIYLEKNDNYIYPIEKNNNIFETKIFYMSAIFY